MPRLKPPQLLALVALFMGSTGLAHAQNGSWPYTQADVPRLASDALSTLTEIQAGNLTITGPDVKDAEKARIKKLFDQVATYYTQKATEAKYYAPNELEPLRAASDDNNFSRVLRDISNKTLVPDEQFKLTLAQNDYIQAYGQAFNQAIRDVLTVQKPNVELPNSVIRVNVGQILALVSESGASALAPTLTAMLTNQFYKVDDKFVDTPPELYLYALKAAENLLAAHDPLAVQLAASNKFRHSIPDDDLVPLVQILMTIVEQNPPVARYAGSLDPEKAIKMAAEEKENAANKQLDARVYTPEQADLVVYFRRAAVRALAKVRFDTLGGAAGVPKVRPGFVLAKIAVNDQSIVPAATTSEIGAATLGLIDLNPSPDLNLDYWFKVIGTGIVNFIQVKAGRNADTSLLWQLETARMKVELNELLERSKSDPRLNSSTARIQNLSELVDSDIAKPILEARSPATVSNVNVDRVRTWKDGITLTDTNFYRNAGNFQVVPR